MNDLSNTIFRHDPNIVSRAIAGETILVPVRKNVGDLDHIYTLNETAARIWELFDGQRSTAEIVQQVVEEFEIDPLQAEQDLTELIGNLQELGALAQV